MTSTYEIMKMYTDSLGNVGILAAIEFKKFALPINATIELTAASMHTCLCRDADIHIDAYPKNIGTEEMLVFQHIEHTPRLKQIK